MAFALPLSAAPVPWPCGLTSAEWKSSVSQANCRPGGKNYSMEQRMGRKEENIRRTAGHFVKIHLLFTWLGDSSKCKYAHVCKTGGLTDRWNMNIKSTIWDMHSIANQILPGFKSTELMWLALLWKPLNWIYKRKQSLYKILHIPIGKQTKSTKLTFRLTETAIHWTLET